MTYVEKKVNYLALAKHTDRNRAAETSASPHGNNNATQNRQKRKKATPKKLSPAPPETEERTGPTKSTRLDKIRWTYGTLIRVSSAGVKELEAK